jgi:hypothetical protein
MSFGMDPLGSVRVASPCPANWDEMIGDGRKRYCGDCKLNVYNLSGMTRNDAEDLLRNSEGRLCVRYFRRADGTILTRDCPVGWAKVKQRASKVATAAFSIFAGFFGGIAAVSVLEDSAVDCGSCIPITRPEEPPVIMGTVAYDPEPDMRAEPIIEETAPEFVGRIVSN